MGTTVLDGINFKQNNFKKWISLLLLKRQRESTHH